MAEETKPLVERLREACNGHPHAKIPWPHRLLHEAADRIAELEAIVGQLPRTADGVPVVPGDTVFHIDHRGRVESVVANVIDGESIIYGTSSFIMIDDCYSTATKALTQAAGKEGEAGDE